MVAVSNGPYSSADAARILGIASVTVRLYCRKYHIGKKLSNGKTSSWVLSQNDLSKITEHYKK